MDWQVGMEAEEAVPCSISAKKAMTILDSLPDNLLFTANDLREKLCLSVGSVAGIASELRTLGYCRKIRARHAGQMRNINVFARPEILGAYFKSRPPEEQDYLEKLNGNRTWKL